MLSAISKLEPIAAAMPTAAIIGGVHFLGIYLNQTAPTYIQRKAFAYSAICLTSGLSTLYSKKMGIIASTVAVLGGLFYATYSAPLKRPTENDN